jgi:Fe-S oxidoreductase
MFLSDKERAETIWACRYCPMCQHADRVASLMRKESYTPRGRGTVLLALEKGLLSLDESVADIMYTSINDGLLQEWCVGNYDHEELILDTRARLFEKGLAPKEVAAFVESLHAGPKGREPEEILSQAKVVTHPGAETLLFAGCSARETGPSILISMGRLFNRANVKFQVLRKEPCCGWPLYQLGDMEGARNFSITLARAIQESGATTVVLLDADCYRMLLTRNSRLGGDLKEIRMVHALKLLSDWLEEGKIRIENRLPAPATYHDPCALARYCEDLDSPRKILSVLFEREIREMTTHKRMANCCGEGGMLSVYRPDLAKGVSQLRLKEAEETGATLLATGCPRCQDAFTRAIDPATKEGLRVAHLIDLVAFAAGLG